MRFLFVFLFVLVASFISAHKQKELKSFFNNQELFNPWVEQCAQAQKAGGYMTQTLVHENRNIKGWKGYHVKLYEYKTGKDKISGLEKRGLVYLLNPSAEQLAKWIATACFEVTGSLDMTTMSKLLKFIQWQSGSQFPVCGVVYEDMDGNGYYPYIFKDGITVYVADTAKWRTPSKENPNNYYCTDEQLEYLTHLSDDQLKNYTGRYARICSTTREQYIAICGNRNIGKSDSPETRSKRYMHAIRKEYKKALHSNRNRLINAWLKANIDSYK